MTVLDTSLWQTSGEANASLDGQPFRLNPTSISLPYTAKVTQTKTLGGMVVQVFGITLGDLEITGTFGAGGFTEQEAFLQRIMTEGQTQAQMVIGQPMSPPVRFLFPLLGYDFNVYLKQFTSPQGAAVVQANEIIAPEWTLIFVIDNDNTNLIQQQTDSYISRLASGLGYQINQFNGPNTGDTSYLQSVIQKDGGPVGFLNTYYGAQVQTAASSGAAGSAAASTGPTTLSGSGNEQQCFNYFVTKGLTPTQSAGIIGNLMQESQCDPTSVQPGGPGRGIAQWSLGGRWSGVIALAAQQNKPPTDLGVQLDYLWSELTGAYANALSALKATSDVTSAVTAFEQQYEAAGDPQMSSRIQYAQQALSQYGGGKT